eukprot:5937868-Prymnesium_polylepis.1
MCLIWWAAIDASERHKQVAARITTGHQRCAAHSCLSCSSTQFLRSGCCIGAERFIHPALCGVPSGCIERGPRRWHLRCPDVFHSCSGHINGEHLTAAGRVVYVGQRGSSLPDPRPCIPALIRASREATADVGHDEHRVCHQAPPLRKGDHLHVAPIVGPRDGRNKVRDPALHKLEGREHVGEVRAY